MFSPHNCLPPRKFFVEKIFTPFPISLLTFPLLFQRSACMAEGGDPPGDLRASPEPDPPPSENPDKEPDPGKFLESQAVESLSQSLGPSAGGSGDPGDSSVDPGRPFCLKKITRGQAAESLSLSRAPSANGVGDLGDSSVDPGRLSRLRRMAHDQASEVWTRNREIEHCLEYLTDELSRAGTTERVEEITTELNALRLEAARLQVQSGVGRPPAVYQHCLATGTRPRQRRAMTPLHSTVRPSVNFAEALFSSPGSLLGGGPAGERSSSPRGVTIPADSTGTLGPEAVSLQMYNEVQGENRALRLRISRLLAEDSRGVRQQSRSCSTARLSANPRSGRGVVRSRSPILGRTWDPFNGTPGPARIDPGIDQTPAPVVPVPPAIPALARPPAVPDPGRTPPSLSAADFLAGLSDDPARNGIGRAVANEPARPSNSSSVGNRGSRSQPPSGNRPRLQEIQIKFFEGSEGDCFRDWKETEWQPFFEYMRLDEIQPRMRAFLLRSKLGKRARQYVDSKAPRDGPLTYERMLELLELRYSPQAIRNAMKLKFQNRDREEGEPIDVYLDDLGYLYLQSHVEMGARESELAVIERALNGMDPTMAAKIDEMWAVVPEENRTTDALIQAVQHLELKRAAVAAQANLQRRQQSLSLPRGGSNQSVTSNASSVPSQPGSQNRRYEPTNRPNFYSNQRVAPRPPADAGVASSAPVPAASGGDSPVVSIAAPPVTSAPAKPPPGYAGCFVCKALDHYARDCGVRNEVKFISSLDSGSLCNESCTASCVGHLVCATCEQFGHTSGTCARPVIPIGPGVSPPGNA